MREDRRILNILGIGFCLLCAGMAAFAQTPIGGIVNDYIQVYEILSCDSAVKVTNSQRYSPADRVLMIQMKGARIYTSNDSLFGQIISIGTSGYAEFLTIKSVNGDLIEFTTRLTNDYDVNGSIQLVRVARYDSARITSPITAPPWNGTIGGIVCLEVSGNLYLNNIINVSGLGFRGGSPSINNEGCNTTDYVIYDWLLGKSGEKGEGIASLRVNAPVSGRGPLGNGGGGGNGTNSGGGGGSNGGRGGMGGDAVRYCNTNRYVGGIPGNSLASFVPQQRLFFGGGGGGGHQNNDQGVDFQFGTGGNHGGGIVLIRANTIYGNGFSILADGLSVRDTTEWDGAGAGGAGGTILIECNNVASPLSISAEGGNGGNVKNPYSSHGPGGGGGGGVVVLSKAFPNVSINVAGGKSGLELDSNNADNNYLKQNGSTDGDYGVIFTNGMAWRKPYSITLSVQGDAELCPGQPAVLVASEGFISYKWSNGDTSRVITVMEGGKYYVTTVDQGGCVHKSRDITIVYDPISFKVSSPLDFGVIDYKQPSFRTFAITNTDDEAITVDSITGFSQFTLVSPNTFPIKIPAGSILDVVVSITPPTDTTYADVVRVFVSNPCTGSADVRISAVVNGISVRFDVPDTNAKVGTIGFTIPIKASITASNKSLDSTVARITLKFDDRTFAPSGVQSGIIVGDIIDRIYNIRTITIETNPVNITREGATVALLEGTILNGTVDRTLLSIANVEYKYVFQTPTTILDTGSIQTDYPCFKKGRQITFYKSSLISAYPNPARDILTINVNLSAPGKYEVNFFDILGQLIYTDAIVHDGVADTDWDFTIDVSVWPVGSYLMVFSAPLSSYTRQIDILR
jgi:hypothetical protein